MLEAGYGKTILRCVRPINASLTCVYGQMGKLLGNNGIPQPAQCLHYELQDRVSISDRFRDFCVSYRVKTDPLAPPATYTVHKTADVVLKLGGMRGAIRGVVLDEAQRQLDVTSVPEVQFVALVSILCPCASECLGSAATVDRT